MTLSDVKAMDLDVISPDIVAQVLRCNPHYIRFIRLSYAEIVRQLLEKGLKSASGKDAG